MKLFKSKELRKSIKELVDINKLKDKFRKMSDEKLQNMTNVLRDKIKNGASYKDIRPEAFAVVREATFRILKKWPFDVQMIGGMILDSGSVAEMKTGEGKTIASIAPVYLNALSGEGVIISTVNEYLTQRDAEETSQVYNWLGLTVGVNLSTSDNFEKAHAYACDITYSVHSEIGFDYLKDNMVKKIEEKVQRKFNFALIDEVDSILIDEARTPLIISGGSSENSTIYTSADQFVKTLTKKDYEIDWESKSIQLVESGIEKVNNFFGVTNIFEIENSELIHRVNNSLRANYIMFLDADYIVREDEILIVDAFTGRIMEGRSFSDGLHQSIQAKENVTIEQESNTLATITYQNLFRMFTKLSGMTGTGKTEEDEFIDIYNMKVYEIETNMPMIRIDHKDKIFVTKKAKQKAILEDIKKRYEKGQPVLVGTEEVSESESLSRTLKKENIPHLVLNAKQNDSEAEIISHAGEYKSITIATNMAGRGTDIKPSKKSLKLGGLYVLGTNKAESRRIDNQLRGRSGRQGDIGESIFYLSLEDKLISRFSNQPKLKDAFSDAGDEEINSRLVRRQMKMAQIKIEGFNFDARKNVLQFDDIIRQQRDLIYAQRDIIIGESDLHIVISRMMNSVINDLFSDHTFDSIRNRDKTINREKIATILNGIWFSVVDHKIIASDIKGHTDYELSEYIKVKLQEAYNNLRNNISTNIDIDSMHDMEREIILKTFDENWELHLEKMTKLRTASTMASYAQQNPYQVYIEKGGELFNDLLKRISHNTVKIIMANQYGDPNMIIESGE